MTQVQSLGWILLGISAGMIAVAGVLDIQKRVNEGKFPISKRHFWNDGIWLAILAAVLILARS